MKRSASLVLLLLAFAVSSSLKAQKIAHVHLDSLLSSMPESKKAQNILQEYGTSINKEISAMKAELQALIDKYTAEEKGMSDLIKQTRQQQIQALNQRIDDFSQQANQDYQQKTNELSKPVYDKARKAVEMVAKENGYKYVLDTSSGMVVYNEPTDDILPLVKKKLDSMPELVLPGSGTSGNPPKTGSMPPKTGTR